MHRQCSFWGRDITHPTGNLLVRYGCRRSRDASDTASRYSWLAGSQKATLWGFGIFYSEGGDSGVFLKRYSFQPCLLDVRFHDEWSAADAPNFSCAEADDRCRHRLFLGALQWMEAYEDWVQAQPMVYRPRTGSDFRLGAGHGPAAEWNELRQLISAWQDASGGDSGARLLDSTSRER